MIDIEEVNKQINLLALAGNDTELKKVSSSGGGEWAGPCPFCGGKDRFRLQPDNPTGARWLCRGCTDGKWNDSLAYGQKRYPGMKLPELCAKLTITAPAKEEKPKPPEIDRPKWVEAVSDFMDLSVPSLWADMGKRAREWLHNRGLDDDCLDIWKIGYNPADRFDNPSDWGLHQEEKVYLPRGIVIQNLDPAGIHYIKIRRPAGDPKYYIVKGSRSWIYGAQTIRDNRIAFLFEAEFDALLAWNTGLAIGTLALPAGQYLKSEWSRFFKPLEYLVIAYDNDKAGNKAAGKLAAQSPCFVKAECLPMGKDLAEYHQTGGDVLQYLLDELARLGGSKNGS